MSESEAYRRWYWRWGRDPIFFLYCIAITYSPALLVQAMTELDPGVGVPISWPFLFVLFKRWNAAPQC